jgi:hypothetical protein
VGDTKAKANVMTVRIARDALLTLHTENYLSKLLVLLNIGEDEDEDDDFHCKSDKNTIMRVHQLTIGSPPVIERRASKVVMPCNAVATPLRHPCNPCVSHQIPNLGVDRARLARDEQRFIAIK